MKIAVDRVSELVCFSTNGLLLNTKGIQIFILKDDWDSLPFPAMNQLAPFFSMGVLTFIDINELFFADIVNLTRRFGTGIKEENFLILQYCKQERLVLISNDTTITSIAGEIGIEVNDLEFLTVRLIEGEVFIKDKKALIKKSGDFHQPDLGT